MLSSLEIVFFFFSGFQCLSTNKSLSNLIFKMYCLIFIQLSDYNFIINRKPNGSKTSVEKFNAFNDFSQKKEADMQIKGKDLMITVSLKTLGLKKDKCAITLKVADNIMRVEDFSTFYTTGDCAPYGRLSYSYGY